MEEIKSIDINIEKIPANPPQIVTVEFFVVDVERRPSIVEVFCRFEFPKNYKQQITERIEREHLGNSFEFLEPFVRTSIEQYFKRE